MKCHILQCISQIIDMVINCFVHGQPRNILVLLKANCFPPNNRVLVAYYWFSFLIGDRKKSLNQVTALPWIICLFLLDLGHKYMFVTMTENNAHSNAREVLLVWIWHVGSDSSNFCSENLGFDLDRDSMGTNDRDFEFRVYFAKVLWVQGLK
jgi:hypothetical protein